MCFGVINVVNFQSTRCRNDREVRCALPDVFIATTALQEQGLVIAVPMYPMIGPALPAPSLRPICIKGAAVQLIIRQIIVIWITIMRLIAERVNSLSSVGFGVTMIEIIIAAMTLSEH